MVAPDGSEVVVGQHVDRRWRFCQCRRCGCVKKCTPSDDFFVLTKDPIDAGLLCQSCFSEVTKTRFITGDSP